MAISDLKISSWLNAVSDEPDRPQRSAAEMKRIFDSNSNQLKAALNGLIDALVAPTGTEEIGAEAMSGIAAGTLRSQLLALRQLIDQRLASITIGTVTTGPAGSQASASITGTLPNVQLNLTIPRGNPGHPMEPHAYTHFAGGDDALLPSDIGAADKLHAALHAKDAQDPITPEAIGAAGLDESGKLIAEQGTASVVTVDEDRALTLGDQSKPLLVSAESAVTVTIPEDQSAAFPLGTEIELCQYGEGTVNIVGEQGVTLNGVSGGAVSILEKYACVSLKKIGTDEWIAAGGLE